MGEPWPCLLGLLSLGVGLHHLFLSWLRPTERAYLSFGFGAMAFGTHTLFLTPWLTGPIDNLAVSHRLAAIAGHAALVALLLLVWRSLDRPVQRPLRLYLASHGFLVLFLLVAPFRWVFAIDPARLGSMVPGLAAAPLVLVAADRRATSRLVFSSWQWASSCSPDWGGLARANGAPLPSWLPAAGFAGSLLTVQLALAGRFSRAHAELQLRHRDLERRLDQRTRALMHVTRATERTQRAQGEFLTNMSHELRTPLNSVIGFANVLLRQAHGFDERQRDFLQRIRAAGNQLLELVNDVLDLARLEAGRLEIRLVDTEVGEVARKAARDLEEAAHAKALYLDVRAPPQLRPVRVDNRP